MTIVIKRPVVLQRTDSLEHLLHLMKDWEFLHMPSMRIGLPQTYMHNIFHCFACASFQTSDS